MMALQSPMASHFARQSSKLDADFFPSMLDPGEAPWTTGPQYEQRTPQLDGGDNGGSSGGDGGSFGGDGSSGGDGGSSGGDGSDGGDGGGGSDGGADGQYEQTPHEA